ncbi:ABC transporter ATP-binding protein [Atopobacter sp. AH10]|uniref:ABC transporter ATP-binding protein n=1 Tax=Atopobacter sp. AH10 TaxID=2315861 RepID=UPI000EF23FF0|nr:ABC transporter ATP-binding protein [Atopobacter sp. AH10]RLK63945.1 ABC transporter ATP-binding protein [Atopobacter sp. AH10]
MIFKKDRQQYQSYQRFWKFIRSVRLPWWHFIFASLIDAYSSFLVSLLPNLEGEIAAGKIFDKSLVTRYAIFSVILGLTQFFSVYPIWVRYQFDRRLEKQTFSKFLSLPLAVFEKFSPSRLISRVTDDSGEASMFLVNFTYLLTDLLTCLFMTFGMLRKSLFLSLLTLPFFLLQAVTIVFANKRAYSLGYLLQNQMSKMTAYLAERANNLRYVKASGQRSEEIGRGREVFRQYFKAALKKNGYNVILKTSVEISASFLTAGVLIGGAYMVNRHSLSMANLISFYIYSAVLPDYLTNLLMDVSNIKRCHGSLDIVTAINSLPNEELDEGELLPENPTDSNLATQGLSFQYGQIEEAHHALFEGVWGQDQTASPLQEENEGKVKDLNIEIPHGKITAIVGASGSGKSTLLKLIAGLYQPLEGQISWNGQDISAYSLAEWRRKIAFVLQDSALFSGTIRENLLLAAKKPWSTEELMDLCQRLNLKEFIDSLPNGLDEGIWSSNQKMSGGQLQRLALARAIVAEPEILILDEATSNLDRQNANEIDQCIREAFKDKTVIAVSHRMINRLNPDHIIVMKDGEVEDSGSHEELLKRPTTYAKYYNLEQKEAA